MVETQFHFFSGRKGRVSVNPGGDNLLAFFKRDGAFLFAVNKKRKDNIPLSFLLILCRELSDF
jgi:hypothetical protein